MSTPISTRTRQRTSTPLLTLTTTLTHPSRISKRTPISRSRLVASPAPSTASAMSSISLASALSFATNATSPSSPRTAAKAIAAATGSLSPASSTAGPAPRAAGKAGKQVVRTKRVVQWPSQLYAQSARSVSPDEPAEGKLDGYLELLQGALSRASSVRGSSASASPSPSPSLDR